MIRSPFFLLAGLALGSLSVRAEPIDVDFQNTSDYHEGSLNGQNGWVVRHQAPANADFVVTPGTGLVLSNNTGGSSAATYAFINDKDNPAGKDNFSSGTPLSFAANFTLKQGAPARAQVFGLGWGLYNPVDSNNLPFIAELTRDPESGGYRLRLACSTKTTVTGETIAKIPEADLGFKPTGESDPLQLSLTLTCQGKASDWTSVCMLTNLATGKAFVLKNTLVAPEVYKMNELLRGLVNYRRNADGLESVVITRLDAEVTPDPAAQ